MHRAFAFGRIIIRTFVNNLSVGATGHEAMQGTRRHEQLTPILKAYFKADPLAIGRAAMADIASHVMKGAPATAHQLGLRMWRGLKMQAPQGSDFAARRMIALYKVNLDPGILHTLTVPAFAKKAMDIAIADWRQDQDPGQFCLFNLHSDFICRRDLSSFTF